MSMPSSRDEVATIAGAALLQRVLDLQALLPGERAVMGAHEILIGELVQACREALGQPSRVREHDRGPVRADQLQQRRMDRRPDRVSRLGTTETLGSSGSRSSRVHRDPAAHVLHGHHDLELHRLAMPGVDRHGPLVAVERASEEPRDLLERPLRGGQPDPLRRHVAELLEPLQGQARCEPRLEAAIAWISSTITVRTLGASRERTT